MCHAVLPLCCKVDRQINTEMAIFDPPQNELHAIDTNLGIIQYLEIHRSANAKLLFIRIALRWELLRKQTAWIVLLNCQDYFSTLSRSPAYIYGHSSTDT
jgi:hypothetical protein